MALLNLTLFAVRAIFAAAQLMVLIPVMLVLCLITALFTAFKA